jgi:hypothetical protein
VGDGLSLLGGAVPDLATEGLEGGDGDEGNDADEDDVLDQVGAAGVLEEATEGVLELDHGVFSMGWEELRVDQGNGAISSARERS